MSYISLTNKLPLAARLVRIEINGSLLFRGSSFVGVPALGFFPGAEKGHVDAVAIVRPRSELEFTVLIVEREPANVDPTRRDEQTEWNPVAQPVRVNDHVGRKLTVDILVRAVNK